MFFAILICPHPWKTFCKPKRHIFQYLRCHSVRQSLGKKKKKKDPQISVLWPLLAVFRKQREIVGVCHLYVWPSIYSIRKNRQSDIWSVSADWYPISSILKKKFDILSKKIEFFFKLKYPAFRKVYAAYNRILSSYYFQTKTVEFLFGYFFFTSMIVGSGQNEDLGVRL